MKLLAELCKNAFDQAPGSIIIRVRGSPERDIFVLRALGDNYTLWGWALEGRLLAPLGSRARAWPEHPGRAFSG